MKEFSVEGLSFGLCWRIRSSEPENGHHGDSSCYVTHPVFRIHQHWPTINFYILHLIKKKMNVFVGYLFEYIWENNTDHISVTKVGKTSASLPASTDWPADRDEYKSIFTFSHHPFSISLTGNWVYMLSGLSFYWNDPFIIIFRLLFFLSVIFLRSHLLPWGFFWLLLQ